ncbi:hypothetical protein [Cryptobacterium curtum]|uniref:hypothetical protein n=1 Tax=Cryptobacterium curtum TaxID=84163 RepID=UPI0028D68E60|nr:hypothetical protein [Cryptobacterium curtum]
MTQRNPMNERYQSDDRTGKTRKSAASAKPVSKAGASVRVASGKKQAASRGFLSRLSGGGNAAASKKQQEREARARYYNPDTPEYHRWRRYWWISIVLALSLTALSFVVQIAIPDSAVASYVLLGVGYALLIFAIWVDMGKVHKIRRAYADRMMAGRSKAATRARKAEKAATQKEAAEARKLGEAEAAKRDAKAQVQAHGNFFTHLFSKGKSAAAGVSGTDTSTKASAGANTSDTTAASSTRKH